MSITFTDGLCQMITPIYRKLARHPFLHELTVGRLDKENFKFYLNQYLLLLKESSRGLSIMAAKAPAPSITCVITEHAKILSLAEKELLKDFLKQLKLQLNDAYKTPMIPAVLFYSSYLVKSAYEGSFHESLSAFLPHYLIYYEVAKTLSIRASTIKLYNKWINAYTEQKYAQMVEQITCIANKMAKSLTIAEKNKMKDIFITSAKLEYMFWDRIHKRQTWDI
jgi:thiaminase/transcriptional activator TenA